MALPAFAAERPCGGPELPQPGYRTASKLLLRCCNGTDRRTLDSCIDPAPHTMRSVPTTAADTVNMDTGADFPSTVGATAHSGLSGCPNCELRRTDLNALSSARRCASLWPCVHVCVCLSVRLSQVGVLSKGLNGLIWFLAWRLLSTSPILCFKEIQVSTKIKVLPLELFPKLRT